MKKKVITLLMSLVLASGSIGNVQVLAADTTEQETEVGQEEETNKEVESEEQCETDDKKLESDFDKSSEEIDSQIELRAETQDAEEQTHQDLDVENANSVEESNAQDTDHESKTQNVISETDIPEDLASSETEEEIIEGFSDELLDRPAYVINDDVFKRCDEGVTKMVIPEGITRIADHAFDGCSSLQSVEIPDSVTSIGKYAFYNCSSLKSITIPDGVTAIEEYTFCNCGLENIVIPNNVTVIGAHAFERCFNIKSITLPIELKRIEENAFECTGIEDIRLPNGLEYIGEGAFEGSEDLTSITIPDSVTYMGGHAFGSCNSLTRVQLGRGISQIGDYTFAHCHFLEDITIPDNITSIGKMAFYYCCNNLKNIKLPNTLIDIGDDAFRDCSNLEELVIPKTVKRIGGAAFYDCSSLSSVKLPENLESIGDHAFVNCTSLKSITIPNNVKEIGDELFRGCEGTCVVISKSLNVIDYCKKHNYKHFYSNAPSVQNLSSYNGSDFRIFVEKRENASGYQIKYATNKEMAGAKSVILKGADNSSKVISGLKNGNVYYIKVQAFQKIGDKTYWTSWSPVSSIKITQTPYPTNVSKLSTFIGSHIKVDWTKTAGASGYHIKYADNSSMTNAKEVMVKGNSTFSKTFTGLKNGKTYYVKIQTYRTVSGKTYWSSWSPAKSIKVDQTPYGSSIKKLTRESSTKMKVTWDKAPSASGYHIQYYWNDNNNNRVTKDIFINDNGSLSKTFTGMKKYTPIYVRIQTFKKISGKTYWSPWSKAKDIFLY